MFHSDEVKESSLVWQIFQVVMEEENNHQV